MDNLTGIPDFLREDGTKKASTLNSFVLQKLYNSVENSHKEQVTAHLANSFMQNKQVKELVQAAQVDSIINEFENHYATKTRVSVRAKLTAGEQCRLANTFCMFNLDFSNADDSGPHSFARAHRKLSMEMLLRHANITKTSTPGLGYDAVFKDVGGNPVSHLTASRHYSHCCSPVLDINDAARKSRYYEHLRTIRTVGMKQEDVDHYNLHMVQDGRVVCKTVAEHCHVKAPVLLFIHSVYDIRLSDIAQMMYNSDANVAYGCFIFDVAVLYKAEGELESIGCCYRRFRRNGRVYIRFWFPNDTQLGYEHDYLHYLELVYTFVIAHKTRYETVSYLCNVTGVFDNVLFFEVLRNTAGDVPSCRAFRVFTDATLNDVTVINYWHYDTLTTKVVSRDIYDRMVPCRIIVPTSLFDNLVTYAFNLPESKFTVKNILCAATSLNNRFVTNGAVVKSGPKIDPFMLQKLAHAVFLLVYISTYECSQALMALLKQETAIRELSDSSFVTRIWANLRQRVRQRFSVRSKVNVDEVPLVDDVPINGDIRTYVEDSKCESSTFLKGFFEWFARKTSVTRLLNTDVQKNFVKYFSVETEIGEILQNTYDSDRVIINDSALDLDPYRAMLLSLPDDTDSTARRFDITHCINDKCRVPVKTIYNDSNGHCVLQSFVDSGVPSELTVADVRNRLSKCSYLSNFDHLPCLRNYVCASSVSDLKETPPPAMELLMLCALEYRIAICVHIESSKSCYRFSKGETHHFLIKRGHCQYLEAWHELPRSDECVLAKDNVIGEYNVIKSRTAELRGVLTLEKVVTSMNKRTRNAQVQRAFKICDPTYLTSMCGYRLIPGIVTAEACVRAVLDRFDHSRTSIVVGANSSQLEAVMSCVNGKVYFVPTLNSNDVRAMSVEDRLYQFTQEGTIVDLNRDSVRIDLYLSIVNKSNTGVDRVIIPTSFFCQDYICPNNDKLFKFLPVNLHFSLSVLRIGGSATFILTELCSERSLKLLTIVNSLFTRVTITRLLMCHQSLWVFVVQCLSYSGDKVMRDALLDLSTFSYTDVVKSVCEYAYACTVNVDSTVSNVVKELSRAKKLSYYHPPSQDNDLMVGNLLSNRYAGTKSLSCSINRMTVRPCGTDLGQYVDDLISSGRVVTTQRFQDFANIKLFDSTSFQDVPVFPNFDHLVSINDKFDEIRLHYNLPETGDPSIDEIIKNRSRRNFFISIFGNTLYKKFFKAPRKNMDLACPLDRHNLGINVIRSTGGYGHLDNVVNHSYARREDYGVDGSDDSAGGSDSGDDDSDDDGTDNTARGTDPFENIAVDATSVPPPANNDSSSRHDNCNNISNKGIFDLIGLKSEDYNGDVYKALRSLVGKDEKNLTDTEESFAKNPPSVSETPSLTTDDTNENATGTSVSSYVSVDDVTPEGKDIPVGVVPPSDETKKTRDFLKSLSEALSSNGMNIPKKNDVTPTSADYYADTKVLRPVHSDNPVINAVEEFKAMLILTHTAHTSNLARVYKRYISGVPVVSNFVGEDTFPTNGARYVIPQAKDFGIFDRNFHWVIRPQNGKTNVDDYGWYFDGKSIVPMKKKYFSEGIGHVVVNDYCLRALDGMTYDAVKDIDVSSVDLSVINFVQAVPGAGKTTYIMNTHTPFYCENVDDVSNVVLCTTEGKEDFHGRMIDKARKEGVDLSNGVAKRMDYRYRTLASVLINNHKVVPSDTLFIDEAFMHHPGALFLTIAITKPSFVNILGDCLQIPYVNRLETFIMRYGDLNEFVKPTLKMNKSYRCPVDVAKLLSSLYERANLTPGNDKRGMISTRPVAKGSMEVKKLVGYASIVANKDIQVVTFTQSCKGAMIKEGYKNVSTIHEYQGKQAPDVILVRDTDSLEDRLPNDMHYLIVAVSRHTRSFVYYTRRVDDKLSKMIKQFYDSGTNFSSHLDTSAGSIDFSQKYLGELKRYVAPNAFKTFSRRDPNGRKLSNFLSVTSGERTFVSNARNPKGGYDLVLCVGPVINARSLRAAAPLLREFVLTRGIRELDLREDCFEELQPLVVSSVLYQFVGKECRYYRNIGEKFDEVPYEVFEAMNRNAMCDIPNREDIEVTELYNFKPIERKVDIADINIGEMQCFVDDVFLGFTHADQSYDSWMVHHYDLDLSLGDLRIIPHRALYENKRFDNMTPVLKTPIPHIRSEFTAELCVALQKRNCNVPECQGIVDVDAVSTQMLENLIYRCFSWEKLPNVVAEPIRVSSTDICEWLKNQPLSVVDQIVGDFSLHDSPLNEYLMSIKSVAKPILKPDAEETYAPLQTILYHQKFINAIFCPIFREIKARLHSCLSSNLKVYSDVSMKDFEEIMDRDIGDAPFALFSGDDSLIFNGSSYLEVDISKYDKSQGDLALEYELKYMRFFGVPEYYIELWRNAHVSTVARSMNTGTKISINYQRKSGDASTFLGNTLFLMGILAYVIPFDQLDGMNYDDYLRSHIFTYVFNLEVKFFRYKVPYFCSKFVINSDSGWKIVPDPVKLLCKLGRHDLVNEFHVECYRISLSDHLEGFSYVSVTNDVAVALAERYLVDSDYSYFLSRLPKLVTKSFFSSLYEALPGSNIDRSREDFCIRD